MSYSANPPSACASFFPPPPPCAGLNSQHPNADESKRPASNLAIIGLGAALYARRWPLYLAISVAVAAIQAALYFNVHVPRIESLVFILLGPFIVTVVYVHVQSDAADDGASAGELWGRILERLWAVIVIDFVGFCLNFAFGAGLGWAFLPGGGFSDLLIAAAGLAALGITMFADIRAAVVKDVSPVHLLPDAFSASARLALRNPSRIFFLLAVNIFASTLISLLYGALHARHVRDDLLWSNLPLEVVLAAPLAAVTTAFYLESLKRETETAS